jgi:hypothetical protein
MITPGSFNSTTNSNEQYNNVFPVGYIYPHTDYDGAIAIYHSVSKLTRPFSANESNNFANESTTKIYYSTNDFDKTDAGSYAYLTGNQASVIMLLPGYKIIQYDHIDYMKSNSITHGTATENIDNSDGVDILRHTLYNNDVINSFQVFGKCSDNKLREVFPYKKYTYSVGGGTLEVHSSITNNNDTDLGVNTSARYFFIQLETVHKAMCFSEIEIYDENGNNIALNKTAKQSSDWSNAYPASKAVNGTINADNNIGTGGGSGDFHHTKQPSSGNTREWLGIDLGEDKNIAGIRIYSGNYPYSVDGDNQTRTYPFRIFLYTASEYSAGNGNFQPGYNNGPLNYNDYYSRSDNGITERFQNQLQFMFGVRKAPDLSNRVRYDDSVDNATYGGTTYQLLKFYDVGRICYTHPSNVALDVSCLIIGGGGSGGHTHEQVLTVNSDTGDLPGAGGGGGGYGEGTFSILPNTTYDISVGRGGIGRSYKPLNSSSSITSYTNNFEYEGTYHGYPGGNSTIKDLSNNTTIISYGGGPGSRCSVIPSKSTKTYKVFTNTNAGGSSGGASQNSDTHGSNTDYSLSSGKDYVLKGELLGYDETTNTSMSFYGNRGGDRGVYSSGGGGGAGSVGGKGNKNVTTNTGTGPHEYGGGDGGNGKNWALTGTDISYCGGGSGGSVYINDNRGNYPRGSHGGGNYHGGGGGGEGETGSGENVKPGYGGIIILALPQ